MPPTTELVPWGGGTIAKEYQQLNAFGQKNEFLNNSIASIDYKVEWGSKNEHWLSIDIVPEAHSWCEQII